jgi:ABC-type branched-subunit amino acid transport system substrate-binding protein
MPTIGPSRRVFVATSFLVASVFGLSNSSQASDEPIRIGILAPFTGTGGPYGKEIEEAARAAAVVINDAGGVLGRKLELVAADDESVPTSGVAAARKLIDVDKVVAISGVWSSAVVLAVKPIAVEKGVALTTVGSADEITQGDNKGLVWRFQTNGKDWGAAFAKAMAKDGIKTASIMVLQTPFTLSTIEPFRKAFTDAGGKVLDQVAFNPSQPSYRVEVERIFSKEPDAVFVAAYVNELSAIAKETFRSGYDSTIYAYSNAADSNGKFVENVGKEVAEGIVHTQHVPVAKSAAYSRYLKQVNKPEGTVATYGGQVFDQIVMLALAMEKAKGTNTLDFGREFPGLVNADAPSIGEPAEALKAIREGKPFRYSGAASDFRFAPNGDQTNLTYGHFRIANGVSKLVGEIR